jgi:hypothetical protein
MDNLHAVSDMQNVSKGNSRKLAEEGELWRLLAGRAPSRLEWQSGGRTLIQRDHAFVCHRQYTQLSSDEALEGEH